LGIDGKIRMKKAVLSILDYFPFIAIFVMLAVCIIGILNRAPDKKNLLLYCIPIGLWAFFGVMKMAWNKSRGAGQR